MHFESNTMAGTVAEVIAVAGLFDDVAGDRIGLLTGHARPELSLTLLLRLQHNLVDIL